MCSKHTVYFTFLLADLVDRPSLKKLAKGILCFPHRT
jgi:hypothetical protein